MREPMFPDVTVQLSGVDGNAFVLIGTVARALKQAGYSDDAQQFVSTAMACGSYDELLQFIMKTVVVI